MIARLTWPDYPLSALWSFVAMRAWHPPAEIHNTQTTTSRSSPPPPYPTPTSPPPSTQPLSPVVYLPSLPYPWYHTSSLAATLHGPRLEMLLWSVFSSAGPSPLHLTGLTVDWSQEAPTTSGASSHWHIANLFERLQHFGHYGAYTSIFSWCWHLNTLTSLVTKKFTQILSTSKQEI